MYFTLYAGRTAPVNNLEVEASRGRSSLLFNQVKLSGHEPVSLKLRLKFRKFSPYSHCRQLTENTVLITRQRAHMIMSPSVSNI